MRLFYSNPPWESIRQVSPQALKRSKACQKIQAALLLYLFFQATAFFKQILYVSNATVCTEEILIPRPTMPLSLVFACCILATRSRPERPCYSALYICLWRCSFGIFLLLWINHRASICITHNQPCTASLWRWYFIFLITRTVTWHPKDVILLLAFLLPDRVHIAQKTAGQLVSQPESFMQMRWCSSSFATKPQIANHVRQPQGWQQLLSVKSISLWKASPRLPPCRSQPVGDQLPFFSLCSLCFLFSHVAVSRQHC